MRKAEAPNELAVRMLMTYGPTAIMEAVWRDPDDIRPNAAHHARDVKGFRSYDPLRWSLRRHGDSSNITELHIHAADRLRRAADLARLGGLPGTVWAGPAPFTHPDRFRPSSGFPASAQAMLKADREFRRVMSIMLPYEWQMICAIVLCNCSITAWTRYRKYLGQNTSQKSETRYLVAALDKLVAHYDSEIKEDMALGRVEL